MIANSNIIRIKGGEEKNQPQLPQAPVFADRRILIRPSKHDGKGDMQEKYRPESSIGGVKMTGRECERKGKQRDKRGNGEGALSYDEKRKQYTARFTYEDPKTGGKKRKKFVGLPGEKQGEVLKRGRKWIDDVSKGLLPDADKITVKEWLEAWLADYAKQNVRLKSYLKYESSLKQYIYPKFGKVLLVKLKDADLQRHWNTMLESGGKKKQGLSALTVRNTRRYLSMALDQAVRSGYLFRNVAKLTKPPKVTFNEVQVLTEIQTKTLIETSKSAGEVAHIVILLALSSGMRMGEIFGLRWSDIDAKGTIHVQRQFITSVKGKNFGPLKTEKSRRKIPLPASVTKELRKYQKWQEWQAHLMGDKWEHVDPDNGVDNIVTNIFGRVLDPAAFRKQLKEIMIRANIDPKIFSFHSFRHTHASLLLRQGIHPKVVQERLGHSTIAMTMNTYSHLLPDMQETATKALESVFA